MIAVYAFAVWTVFVWGTRVRNILQAEGSALDLGAAVALAALGVAVGVSARKGGLGPVLAVAVVATVVVWAVRVPLMVLLADHGAAFIAVHVSLAVVSVGLGLAAWRATGFWPAARRGGRPVSQAGATGSG